MSHQNKIKHLNTIRSYIRQFFVCGFKENEDFITTDTKEKKTNRKISKSGFGYVKDKIKNCFNKSDGSIEFKRGAKGQVVLSFDIRNIKTNPFYDIYKSKSFSEKDIILRFLMLDYIATQEKLDDKNKDLSSGIDDLCNKYEIYNIEYDKSTCDRHLNEFIKFGLVEKNKNGKGYKLIKHSHEQIEDLKKLKNAIVFFSETDPMGVIGYYTSEMQGKTPDLFRYKQRYLFRAIDSEIIYKLVKEIENEKERPITINVITGENSTGIVNMEARAVIPYKIYISSQSGRQHLFYWDAITKAPTFVRIDQIESVEDFEDLEERYKRIKNNIWGVSSKLQKKTEHIEFVVKITENEKHILEKLKNESRCGKVEELGKDSGLWKFSTDVYDTREMIVWIRSFIGNIVSITCKNEDVKNRLQNDFESLFNIYGIPKDGDGNDF